MSAVLGSDAERLLYQSVGLVAVVIWTLVAFFRVSSV